MHPEMALANAFLNGIKDVITTNYPKSIDKLKLEGYPFVEFERKPKTSKIVINECWFFRSEELKKEFLDLKLMENIIKAENRNDKEIGRILGFPPKAVERFVEKSRYPFTSFDNISVEYCGMHFMSYKSTLLDDIQWLLDNSKPLNGVYSLSIGFWRTGNGSRHRILNTSLMDNPELLLEKLNSMIVSEYGFSKVFGAVK